MIEITIRIKDEDKTYNQKFVLHDTPITMSHDDALLKPMVEEAISNFKGEPDEIVVKSVYFW